MRADPLMTAIHFERRFTALMKYIIHIDEKPLVHVTDHFVPVEFQDRGSPHYHISFGVEGVPIYVDDTNSEVLLQYIRSTVWTHVFAVSEDNSLRELVLKLQSHSHSK